MDRVDEEHISRSDFVRLTRAKAFLNGVIPLRKLTLNTVIQ